MPRSNTLSAALLALSCLTVDAPRPVYPSRQYRGSSYSRNRPRAVLSALQLAIPRYANGEWVDLDQRRLERSAVSVRTSRTRTVAVRMRVPTLVA